MSAIYSGLERAQALGERPCSRIKHANNKALASKATSNQEDKDSINCYDDREICQQDYCPILAVPSSGV